MIALGKQILLHVPLAAVSLLATAFWVDELLYVGKPVAQAVLSTEALKEALDEPDEPTDKGPEGDAARLAQDAGASPPQDSAAAVEKQDGKQPAAAVSASESSGQKRGELTAAAEQPPPLQPPAATPPAGSLSSAEAGQMPPPQSAESQLVQPVQLASSTTEGGLVSFAGNGLSGTDSQGSPTAGSAGFVFEIRFASELNWQTLQMVRGVLPVVVRQRRDFKEVALVMKDGRVAEPIALQELIAMRPEYEGGWAVLLPRERLLDLLEQTINHGSGWEPCCLVEDRRFGQWIAAARDFACAQRQSPDRIAGFQADAWLVRAGHGTDLQLVFRNLVLREAAP
ncbi:MAG TPA: hypothetical protein PLF81_25380 [Candidatus Anammoximicrobium sp.]|nr:hypothetical protein [Candidatus Anammoximicrobium sp.]